MSAADELSMEVVDPGEVGMDPERLERVMGSVDEDTCAGMCDGVVLIVARHGQVVLREAVGKTDLANDRPAGFDDVFCMMSITKQFTAVRVLMDIERGKFCLTTPIREVIPEFGIKGKQNVTVKHVMTHTSGINTMMPFGIPIDQLGDLETVVAFLSNEPVLFRPGTVCSYNATTSMSLLAVMVQRLDEAGRPFRKILEEDLFAPIGMMDTALGLPDRLKERLAPIAVRDRTPGLFDPLTLEAINFLVHEASEMPATTGFSTAGDVFRFAEMLRRGGELDGERVLSPATVTLATTIHTGDMGNHLYDYAREEYGWPEFPANFGLTFFIRGEGIFPVPMGLTASAGSFAGLGAGSNMFMVDPERDLTIVFLSAGLMEETRNQLRCQRLADLVIASVLE
jgi:CubicO group peptidase (beta-lactamase class C family)